MSERPAGLDYPAGGGAGRRDRVPERALRTPWSLFCRCLLFYSAPGSP